MYLYARTLGQSPYQSDAAARQAAQALFTKYESECKGIEVWKPLGWESKRKLSVMDEAIMLRRRIAGLPQLFGDKAELDRRAQLWLWRKREARTPTILERGRLEKLIRMPPELYRQELAALLVQLGYPPDYRLKGLDSELARARCELSINNLRSSGPCGGAEVDDPIRISRQVADHYVQTELGSVLSNQRITCSLFGRTGFCDVHYPKGITIRVNFSKVPYALIAVQVAPKVGPQREYSYWCHGTKVNLSVSATP